MVGTASGAAAIGCLRRSYAIGSWRDSNDRLWCQYGVFDRPRLRRKASISLLCYIQRHTVMLSNAICVLLAVAAGAVSVDPYLAVPILHPTRSCSPVSTYQRGIIASGMALMQDRLREAGQTVREVQLRMHA